MENKLIFSVIVLALIFPSVNPTSSRETVGKNLDITTNYIPGFQIKVLNDRVFFWKQPETSAPEGGYPVLFLFHGASQHAFAWIVGLNQWSKYQTLFTATALDEGFLLL